MNNLRVTRKQDTPSSYHLMGGEPCHYGVHTSYKNIYEPIINLIFYREEHQRKTHIKKEKRNDLAL